MHYHDQKLRDLQPRHCEWKDGASFQNRAYYTSAGGHVFQYGQLSALFGSHDGHISTLRLRADDGRLHADFLGPDNQPIDGEMATRELEYTIEGPALVIKRPSSCRFAETGVECDSSRVKLSCTQHDELALTHVDSATGMIGLIIPVGSRSSTLGLYRRVPTPRAKDATAP